MKTVILKIEGMNCGHCANTIKTLVEAARRADGLGILRRKPGTLSYDPQAVGEDRLVAVVEEPGFRVVKREG